MKDRMFNLYKMNVVTSIGVFPGIPWLHLPY